MNMRRQSVYKSYFNLLQPNNNSNILRMQIYKVKPSQLKHHLLKTICKTEPEHAYYSQMKQNHRMNDILRIRSFGYDESQQSTITHQDSLISPSKSTPYRAHPKKNTLSIKLEHELLSKVYGVNRSDVGFGGSLLLKGEKTCNNSSDGPTITIELSSMKPTDRLFHKKSNVRQAERHLLAKPSKEIDHRTQQKFYEQQAAYKTNISKMSQRIHSSTSKKTKLLHRRKWLH